jgi:ABC-2 type transport system permease protein
MTAFLALLRRDLFVAGRNAGFVLTSVLTQPVLVVLVFGNILPRMGLVSADFRTAMLPGLMSISMLMAGVQGVLMPLSTDLSGTREVDERLLAPITVAGVAFEKVVAGALQSAAAGLITLPVMIALMHQMTGSEFHPRWAALLPLALLAGLLSAAFGLVLGTAIQPRFVGLLFAVVIGPMMLFGCAYYPWSGLHVVGSLRFLFLLNPLVFMSEALRFAVTPEVPPMPLPLLFTGLVAFTLGLTLLGARQFERRTIL